MPTVRSTRSVRDLRSRCGAAPRRRAGFTLLETALATVIIGIGVVALVEAQQAFIKSNDWSTHAATATYLANEIREMTRKLPRHDPVTGLYTETAGGTSTLRGWGPEAGETEVSDFDDLDDFAGFRFRWNGTAGLGDGDLPGPIDAFGATIPQVDSDGTITLDEEGNPRPLQGWTQHVLVEKVDPTNPSVTYLPGDVIPAGAGVAAVAADKFPLRVSVTVSYRGPYDSEDHPVATVVWIVP